ncbi:hypothetical protein WS9_009560 [Paraclostridium sordellii 8483]|uniref:ORF6C domain-containing protein n=1 Tax=Paraclostridium sordellii TaxID=1505 RepID=UPI00102EF695|nr:ORF6C domain-containing protein [Paeniclostridium sordellii]TAN66816.1 hypothetical protein WS9_009560 [Paeniclostridium sordellii 8483]
MNNLQVIDKREIVTMTSLEVVELINNFRKEEGNTVELLHKSFLASIDTELESLKKCKISQQNILPSTYINSRGKKYRCFKMNKAGIMQMLNKESALVRYKTQQYIEKLEEKIKQDPFEGLSEEMKALLMHDKKIQAVQKEVMEVKEDLTEFKEDLPLFTSECEEVSRTVKRIGTRVLGGKGSKAYNNKSLRAKVYSDIHRQLKREFDVNSYKAIKRRYLNEVITIVENYKSTIALNEQISMLNNQVVFAQ